MDWNKQTTVPVPSKVRNRLKGYCDVHDHSSYAAAINALLDDAGFEKVIVECEWCGAKMRVSPERANRCERFFCQMAHQEKWLSDYSGDLEGEIVEGCDG